LLELIHTLEWNVGDEYNFPEELFPLVANDIPVSTHTNQSPEHLNLIMALQLLSLTQVKVVLRQRILDLILQLQRGFFHRHDPLPVMVLNVIFAIVVAKCQQSQPLIVR
jgi:hypothetical protein